MLKRRQVEDAAEALRRLVAAAEAGELDCEREHLQRLRGALVALQEMAPPAVRDTSERLLAEARRRAS